MDGLIVEDLVSIIMPSFNTAQFISESIDSIICQTYKNWELIIVDDCSTDNTDQVVANYNDKRIRFLKNQKNSGAAISRNYAIREAKGEWIAFLDSDDLWLPEKLEKQLNFMKKNSYAFSCSYCTYIDEYSNDIHVLDTCPKHINLFKNSLYNWIASQTAIYHVPTVGLIQIADLKKRNDYAIWQKVLRKTDCFCFPQVLAQYRVRGKSVSHDDLWKLVRSHYVLFHEGEGINPVGSCILTCVNMLFGVIRKTVYVKKINKGTQ